MSAPVLAGNRVRANWGRWVADCPSPWCFSAMQVWAGDAHTVCGDCGTPIPDLIWPADPEGIEALLMARPAVWTRNWEPGETLEQLLYENAAHGILPPAGNSLMLTDGGRIVAGTVGQLIRSDLRRHQIEAATYGGQ